MAGTIKQVAGISNKAKSRKLMYIKGIPAKQYQQCKC
jgi:hypothetical protein